MPTLYLLAGPTASGKTKFALAFAQQYNCEIISCDASAFYIGMDIGTAKPTQQEQELIKHWGIDILPPNAHFSIKDYVAFARKCVHEIVSRGKNVLVVGGSGLYMKSFVAPVVDDVPISENVVAIVEDIEKSEGLNGLVEVLKRYNSIFPDGFDLKNPLRVKKGLMRCLETRKSLCELQKDLQSNDVPFPELNKKSFYIQMPLEVLRFRIRLRVQAMLRAGLIDEVHYLLKKHLLIPGTPAALAIGYRETIQFINCPTSISNLTEAIIQNTYHLAKKQATWFRHQMHFDRYIYN